MDSKCAYPPASSDLPPLLDTREAIVAWKRSRDEAYAQHRKILKYGPEFAGKPLRRFARIRRLKSKRLRLSAAFVEARAA